MEKGGGRDGGAECAVVDDVERDYSRHNLRI